MTRLAEILYAVITRKALDETKEGFVMLDLYIHPEKGKHSLFVDTIYYKIL